ncbi:MAG: hypothetical protein KAR12_13050, partial [Methylococcales bacterium]|nr:hypothetical protein [Methylococcales bacterium]
MKKTNMSTAIRCVIASIALSATGVYAGEIGPRAKEKANGNPNEMVDLIVTYRAKPNAADKSKITGKSGTIHHSFKSIKAHAISIPAQAIKGLSNNPNVDRISFDEPMSSQAVLLDEASMVLEPIALEPIAIKPISIAPVSVPVGPGFSYPELTGLPYTGSGVGVAVIDSGSSKHADLLVDVTDSVFGRDISDAYGHGNHIAGIIGGQGFNGYYTGIAPGSSLISVKALNDFGFGKASDVIAA